MSDSASARVAWLFSKAPRTALVVVVVPGFFTPRMLMHMCSASKTTITPCGCSCSISVSAICEVAVAALREMAVQSEVRRENIVGYTLSNGHTLNVLAEGRLVNLAAGNGHPAEIMDMSFAVQALAAEWLTKQTGLEKKVYPVPDTIDDAIGRAKLAAQGLSIDALTPEQEAYLSSWSVE